MRLYADNRATGDGSSCVPRRAGCPDGRMVWGIEFEDHLAGCYLTLALLAVNGKILIKVSGGEFGIRGFVKAFDARTGAIVWKTDTIPGPVNPATKVGPATPGQQLLLNGRSPGVSSERLRWD